MSYKDTVWVLLQYPINQMSIYYDFQAYTNNDKEKLSFYQTKFKPVQVWKVKIYHIAKYEINVILDTSGYLVQKGLSHVEKSTQYDGLECSKSCCYQGLMSMNQVLWKIVCCMYDYCRMGSENYCLDSRKCSELFRNNI